MEVAGTAFAGIQGKLHDRFAENAKRAFDTHEQRAVRALSMENLKNEITEFAGHMNAGSHHFLMLIAEFDRRQGWSDSETHSCAHWLNWKCGIALGAAREKVRTARALENLPKISAAMERGELSYSNARAITRVASAETEDYLLNIALHGTAHHVETTVRQFRRCLDAEELTREAQQQKNRSVQYSWDADGSLVLKARLPAETGAIVLKALEAAVEELHGRFDPLEAMAEQNAENVSPETPVDKPTRTMKRADALGVMAEGFLAHGDATMNGGDRCQIVVHVDAETLRESVAGRCEIEDGPSLAAETARRLACDASIVAMIEDEDGEPLSVGRRTRSIPPALRRALNARDGGCRFPGCTHKRHVDAHHVDHWAHGGETKLSNLVSLCKAHHRAVHEGRIAVVRCESPVVRTEGSACDAASAHNGKLRTDNGRMSNGGAGDGALRFVRPDGQSFDSVAPGHTRPFSDWTQLPVIHQQHGIHIDKKTAATQWCGESMDFGLAIEVLLQQARRGRGVSQETRRAEAGG